jgi:hypothetical protein
MIMRIDARGYRTGAVVVVVIASLFCTAAIAAEPVSNLNVTSSEISGQSLSHVHGIVRVNQAAGDSNVQNNSTAIANSQTGVALSKVINKQQVGSDQAVMPDVMVTGIGDNALRGARGLVSINQVSGGQNRQANTLSIAISHNGEVSDSSLADTRPDVPVNRPDSSSHANTRREASIGGSAFAGASGIVQVNQVAGMGNTSSNRVEMSVFPGH